MRHVLTLPLRQCGKFQFFLKPSLRTIKGRGHNGRNFTTKDVGRRYCPTNSVSHSGKPENVYTFNDEGEVNNAYNGEWELDTDNLRGCKDDFSLNYIRPVFATCKNTCPGGETETHITL